MTQPSTTLGSARLRQNLLRARDLLAQAGWTIQNCKLRNAKGQAFVLEYLDKQESSQRVIATWQKNLEKLGIELRFRVVDFALYEERLRQFDFDFISIAYGDSHNPSQ